MGLKEKGNANQTAGNLSNKFMHFSNSFDKFQPVKTAVKISSIYAISGVLWILLSDKILERLVLNQGLMTMLSMVKGWFYVLVTGILLFFLILKSFNRIQSVNLELIRNYEELATVYEELTATEQELEKQFEMLAESEERYRLISEATNDGIWDEKYGKRYFSERWYQIMGYKREELDEVNDWMSLIHPDDIDMVRQKLEWHKKNKYPYYRCEYRMRHKDGSYRWILSRARLIFDAHGEIIRSAGSHTDITELKKYEEQLQYLAFNDFLTGLPNRTSLYRNVRQYLNDNPDRNMALMFIDADNFKYINDTIGHLAGDELIISMGKRLKDLMDENKSVYRIGGDEFVIFIHHYNFIKEIEGFAEKLTKCFSTPFDLSSISLSISASIGIALYPLHGNDVDTILRCADLAMYEAKTMSRGKYVFYDHNMDQRVKERLMIENELRRALDRNEFELYYQPQVDLYTGKICAVEALLRWKNENLGNVSPLKFISIAEETQLINAIGDWVLQRSCEFLRELHDIGYREIGVSVNVSIIQLMQQDFAEKLSKIIEQTGIPPECLELEITESVFIKSYEIIKNRLENIISRGISVALDDFGKGYSSLSCLTQIPITTLKIDKSFTDTINIDSDMSLISMILMIGSRLGLSVVAEGVESKYQLEYLKKHNCHRVQGFYFSEPLPRDRLLQLLEKNEWQFWEQ